MQSIASTWESAVCSTLLKAAFVIAPSLRSWQVEPSKGRSTQSRVFEGKIASASVGRDGEWWGNSSPAEVFVEGKWTTGANQTHTALECSWQHITSSRPTVAMFFFFFFYFYLLENPSFSLFLTTLFFSLSHPFGCSVCFSFSCSRLLFQQSLY